MISSTMRRFYLYSAIFGISFIMVFVPIVVPMLSREADFSVFNTGWNGSSSFFKDYVSTYDTQLVPSSEDIYLNTVLRDLTYLDVVPDDSIILILGPTRSYSQRELAYLASFVGEGGILALSDDFGVGNEILEYLGLEARFSGGLLLDLAYTSSAVFPVVYGSDGSGIAQTLMLNYASVLTGVSDAFPYSSPASFLDVNPHGILHDREPAGPYEVVVPARRTLGPFALAAVVPYGQGQVHLLSDPSIHINATYDKEDNRAFILEYLGALRGTEGRSLYIDEAHYAHDEIFDVVDVVLATNKNAYVQYGVAAILLLILLHELPLGAVARRASDAVDALLRRNAKKEQVRVSAKELAQLVHEEVPEWDVRSLYSFYAKFRRGGESD